MFFILFLLWLVLGNQILSFLVVFSLWKRNGNVVFIVPQQQSIWRLVLFLM